MAETLPGLGLSVAIELDRPRTLRLNARALYHTELELRRIYGEKKISLNSLLLRGDLGFVDLYVLLWQGLRHEDPALTLEHVLEMADLVAAGRVAGLLREALAQALGPAEPPDAAPAGESNHQDPLG